MKSLDKTLRNQLERTVKEARDEAEAAARSALGHLGVGDASAPGYLSAADKDLRRRLRIHGAQLGDTQDSKRPNPAVGKQETDRLVEELAYEHWHRMLFARFLAENDLLMYPDPVEPVAVSIQECDDLAADEGARNGWELAARFAAHMLPEIFRPDSPVFEVELPPEGQQQLQRMLAELPVEVFQAGDSLGWVYQFWQAKRKDEVNRSEVKIGSRELPAVTQLFTEYYTVEFLLHNTLGAWWAGRNLATEDTESTENEEELRKKLALPSVTWDYLRFVRENPTDPTDLTDSPFRPAAGSFSGWPRTAAEIRVLDPCMGSGHFLVFALPILAALRTAEEDLAAADAVDAVLRDNLFGLEIDPRCTQIAAFNLALTAWRMTGFRRLPPLNLACTGIAPQAAEDQWVALAEQVSPAAQSKIENQKSKIENGLRNLHQLFSDAPTLGSLIDPNQLPSDMYAANYETLKPYLDAALSAEQDNEELRERAVAAAGMVKAADLLAGDYTLVITNVPYLGRLKQDTLLRSHLETHFSDGKADLATAFLVRCVGFCAGGATTGVVTPQNWLLIGTYENLRMRLLRTATFTSVSPLGPHAFETIGGEVVNVALICLTNATAPKDQLFFGLDAVRDSTPVEKSQTLRYKPVARQLQSAQVKNPDARITLASIQEGPLLSEIADSLQGISTGDNLRMNRKFWEQRHILDGWVLLQASTSEPMHYGGREHVLWLSALQENLKSLGGALRGKQAWGRDGISVNRMTDLAATLMTGEVFDINVATLLPKSLEHLAPIYAFCQSPTFNAAVRQLDKKAGVTNATLGKVHFDLPHWQKVAAEKYPNGLPEPESDDPTQWLFHGRSEESTAPLQVAVARLVGYRWPAETEDPHPNPLPEGEGTGRMRLSDRARALVELCDELLPLADEDGLVCIPAVRGEPAAADRLLNLLAKAYGPAWSNETLNRLLKDAGYTGKTLETWLRDGFFAQHCELFHQRPFIWQIWDGLRDGLSILVNYHRLDRKNLETLIYTYLGDWIARQKQDEAAKVDGAAEKIAAAVTLQKKLELIRDGQAPYDIFVRWKPLHQQPIGWEPDLNDGVRLNIRPFLTVPDVKTKGAGVLRAKPKIKWEKDRGKEPERPKDDYPWFWGWDGTDDFLGGPVFTGDRFNNCHYTLRAKTATRERKAEELEGPTR